MFKLIYLLLTIAFAYRGKGGGFSTWGVTPLGSNNKAHGLGAAMVGLALGILTHWWAMPLYTMLWFGFTKPGTGPFLDLCDGFTWVKLLKATARGLLIVPCFAVAIYLGGGSLWALLGCLAIGSIYYLGHLANKWWGKDPVEFSEWAMGLSAIILLGII